MTTLRPDHRAAHHHGGTHHDQPWRHHHRGARHDRGRQVRRPLPASAPAAPPTTRPTAARRPRRPVAYGDPNDPATWERLAQCESGGNWAMNTGNGYYGGLQFSLATWRNVGGAGYPHQATKAEQIKRGQILQAQAGWGQWPHCARELGYL